MTIEPERSFGRLVAHGLGNDQDALYSMRVALPAAPVWLPNFRYWPHFFAPSDQGSQSTCVAHALKHWMQTAPVIQTSPSKPPFQIDLYREIALIDEWPQNDNGDLTWGTSVRAAFKWAQAHGYVTEYRWALNPTDLSEWLLTKGPVVVGIGWFDGMMVPDATGMVVPTGTFRGNHAVLVLGRNRARGDYTLLNSWGTTWGRNGRARIKDADLNRLIFEQGGEAAAGLEVRLS